MADIVSKWGVKTEIPSDLAFLSDGVGRASNAVESHNGMGVLIHVTVAGMTGTNGPVGVYVYDSLGDGNYTGDVDGSAFSSVTDTKYFHKLGEINLVEQEVVTASFSLGTVYGGVVPSRFGIVVFNESGASLSSDSANNKIHYQTVIAEQVS